MAASLTGSYSTDICPQCPSANERAETLAQLICVLCMNGWQSGPIYKAVSGVPYLTGNAAATICMVQYTIVIPDHHTSMQHLHTPPPILSADPEVLYVDAHPMCVAKRTRLHVYHEEEQCTV